MILEVRKVMGRNARWCQEMGRWVEGKCFMVCLAEWPYRIIRLPDCALRCEIQAGDEWVVVQIADWLGHEIEQEEWRIRMEREKVTGT